VSVGGIAAETLFSLMDFAALRRGALMQATLVACATLK
jgi:hypothetical protein